MNKFKKVLTGAIVTAGIACLGGAAACHKDTEPKYYSLSFEGTGLDFVMQGDLAVPDAEGNIFESGTVKEGVVVSFKILRGANVTGTAKIVLSTGEELTPDADGVYSFVMSGDVVVKAEGLKKLVPVTLHKGVRTGTDGLGNGIYEERRISYIGTDGKELADTVEVTEGSDLKFKVKLSPYYVPEFSLICGTEELTPDKDGYYTLSNLSGGAQHVSVVGLEEQTPFYLREGTGDGTEESPYLISTPYDLFSVAALVNMESYDNYNTAHYKLENDIDMQGEQMFIIGNYEHEGAIFSGVFDGDGHTVSNFYITDEGINQETYEKGYLPYVGMFGYAVARQNTGAVKIKNLNLDNFTVSAHPGEARAAAAEEDKDEVLSYVGALVGNSVGLEVVNCSATRGKIDVEGDNSVPIFMGGMVGVMQAAYAATENGLITYDSFVQSSYTNLEMEGIGFPRASGGIVGYLVSADVNAIAYVVNSYSKGSVINGMYAGGIAGMMGRFASIANCYSTAEVYSGNLLPSATAAEQFKHAYAGAIVGYAAEDTVVSNCYAANTSVTAYSASGTKYAHDGNGGREVAGGYVTATATEKLSSIDSSPLMNIGNYSEKAGGSVSALGWSDKDWIFSGENLPTLKYSGQSYGAQSRDLKITVKVKGESGSGTIKTNTVTGAIPAIHRWYEGAMDEYYEDGAGKRTYGYFFDENCTQRVPNGYVPANDATTLYVGFANYSEVAGRYYLQADEYSLPAYIDLTADGKTSFRQGAMSLDGGTYSYDGEKVILYGTCLANLQYTVEQIGGQYFNVLGVKRADGGLDLSGVALLSVIENGAQSYEDADIKFTALKKNADFKYGEYYAADGSGTYTFAENMAGLYTDAQGRVNNYIYRFTDGGLELTVTIGNSTTIWSATVAGGAVTSVRQKNVSLCDGFTGTWSKGANSNVSFTFDGHNNVVVNSGSGAAAPVEYLISGGKASFGSYVAFIDGQTGFLNVNGEIYYRADNFTGSWYMPGTDERIDVTFEGIGTSDHGYANILYSGGDVMNYEAQYDITRYESGAVVRLYVNDGLFGEISYASDGKTIGGMFYSYSNDAYYTNAQFNLYDNFKGTWLSGVEGMDSLTFNGKSANGTGEVTVRTATAGNKRYKYTLTDKFNGTFTASDDTVYTLTYNETNQQVTVKKSDTDAGKLARRDEWSGIVLYDGAISYTFDGKGYIGGKVTVDDNGTKSTLNYTVENGKVTLNGALLTPDGDGLNYNGTILKFNTGFKGDWLVSGSGETLKVGEVDGNFIAKVSYGGDATQYDFVYDPLTQTLTYVDDSTGVRLTTKLKLTSGKSELSLNQTGASKELYRNCIPAANVDGFKGEFWRYKYGEKWFFDGLGNAVHGSGTAVYTVNNVPTTYSYKINFLGNPVILIGKDRYMFREVSEGEFENGGNHYDLVLLDVLQGESVQMQGNTYAFDGAGKLMRKNGSSYEDAYGYTAISSTEADIIQGSTKYLGTITTGGKIKTLELTSYTDLYDDRKVTVVEGEGDNLEEVTYLFKADGKLYRQDGENTVAVYTYTVVSAYKVTLTAIDGGKQYTGDMRKLTSSTRLTIKQAQD